MVREAGLIAAFLALVQLIERQEWYHALSLLAVDDDLVRATQYAHGRLLLGDFTEAHDHSQLVGAYAEREGVEGDDRRQRNDDQEHQ
jgi:hypothetical protein